MQKKIIVMVIILGVLTAGCARENSPQATDNVENTASLCAILKQRIQAETYESSDPATMKRKNAVDEAKLLKEYDSYGCPEILDSAPPPSQLP